ncbi:MULTISPECIES: DUF805 domain-containing protein [Chryseobacterium]|jgi:uncharacterized membrane protein YhaH (DUF805 family)|uniref:DUF805 domain-containing protein n=3 Tax=Chryseobacterium TaxID=59732 RepID=A0A3D9AHT1_9FLAO|nr:MULTISPECIES: DUF805 domain-containing protein [Chryseobacterium]OVE56423.1 hypothetical protein B0E34_12860 [Chryseobacterium mucoviscidosis]REC40582.1 DUF805 domain-containing protein [Candidatus Chryseobacterium massiliae]WBV53088.1 DUF805 domain-containing protein [Chryseobacterium gambrini]BEV03020.1 DUF805 domain-containing protein [Chryseobacterium gambrini]
MKWYLKVLKQYADFNGRARRTEYWMYLLFNLIFAVIAAVLDNILGLKFTPEIPYGYLYLLYALVTFLPGLAVSVRRLHDVDKSGWFLFISLIPIIGGIWLLVLYATEGTQGRNQYGDDPKGNYNEINEIGQKQF